jgi:nitrogenase molybdenum-iron protein NifN
VRNIKSILERFDIDYIMLPDISTTFDAPFAREFSRIPPGGTTYEDIELMGGAKATLEIGVTVPMALSPGKYIEDEFGVPLHRCAIPIGVENCDSFMKTLAEVSQRSVPSTFIDDRGRLIDGMVDLHKLSGEIKALIYGEPDLVYAVTCLCRENGIEPSVISTGSHNALFRAAIARLLGDDQAQVTVLDDTDFETLEKLALDRNVNLIIGNSNGKQITEKYGIPPVRIGFPIQDRYGGQRLVYTGYHGSLKLLDDIANTVLAKKFGMHRTIMRDLYHKRATVVI